MDLFFNQTHKIKNLKQVIKNQEDEVEKMMATQCVKTESLCKLGQTLVGCVNKSLINGFYMIKQREEDERIMELEKLSALTKNKKE